MYEGLKCGGMNVKEFKRTAFDSLLNCFRWNLHFYLSIWRKFDYVIGMETEAMKVIEDNALM